MVDSWSGWLLGVLGRCYTNPTMNQPMWKGSMGSIEIRRIVAVSLNCMGRSRMSVPLRANSDSERRYGQESSTWLVDETSKAPTLR